MNREVFSWDVFFARIGIDPRAVSDAAWRKALQSPSLEIAKVLFHTAYAIAKKSQDGDCAVSWKEIDELRLASRPSASYFSRQRDELASELELLGARLLQRGGCSQYIRTIAYYSGSALVKVIQKMAEALKEQRRTLADYALQSHSPEDVANDLRSLVVAAGQQCLLGFDEQEREDVVGDILKTLASLLDLYRECLTSFSEEDLLEVCRLPVPRPAAARIAELFGRVATERIQIGIGSDGKGVFRFPVEPPVLTSDETRDHVPYDGLWIRITRVCNGAEHDEWLTYKRHEAGALWSLNHAGTFPIRDGFVEVSIVDAVAISRIPVLGNEQLPQGAMDIRPRVCDGAYILLVEHAARTAIYLPGRKLNVNDVCHVLLTSSSRIPTVSIRDEDGSVRKIDAAEIGRIPLEGAGLEALVVDGDEFPIAASPENDWQNVEERFKYLHQAGCRAYPAEVCPVVLEKLPAAESIVYSAGDAQIVLRRKDAGRWTPWRSVPPQFLWQRGTLEVRGIAEVLKSEKMIFTDVDFGDFSEPSQVDKELDPETVSYVNREGKEVCPGSNYQHGDSLIQFEVEGLTVRRPIDRIGVFFITPARKTITITPESEDNQDVTPIALADILNLSCRVVVPREDGCEYNVLLTRGNECAELNRLAQEKIRGNGCTTFHWRDYAKKFSDQNKGSTCFSVCIRNEDNGNLLIYKFRGIDPMSVAYREANGHPRHTVRHILRTDGMLSICHHVAYWDMAGEWRREGVPTSFLCCPIDRLDDEAGFVELPCRSVYHEAQRGGLAQEVVDVPDFRNVVGGSLGNGCVCFLTKKLHYSNAEGFEHRLISSGFFVCDPGQGTVPIGEDTLSRLRHALSVKDEAEIQSILSSEDEQVRVVVGGFLDRVRKNVAQIRAPGVRDYLNLYRCVITGRDGRPVERSGYAFLADWYDFGQTAEAVHGVGQHLADAYRKYWPFLMFPVSSFRHPSPMSMEAVIRILEGDAFKKKCKEMSRADTMSFALFLRFYDAVNNRIHFEGNRQHGSPDTWTCGKSLGKCRYGQYFEYCCKTDKIINWDIDVQEIQRNPELARRIMRDWPYLYYAWLGYADSMRCTPRNILLGLRKREIRDYFISLAEDLAEWRRNPSLNENAQRIKTELLLLEEVDDVMFPRPSSVAIPSADAPYCFSEIVGILALRAHVPGGLQRVMQHFNQAI